MEVRIKAKRKAGPAVDLDTQAPSSQSELAVQRDQVPQEPSTQSVDADILSAPTDIDQDKINVDATAQFFSGDLLQEGSTQEPTSHWNVAASEPLVTPEPSTLDEGQDISTDGQDTQEPPVLFAEAVHEVQAPQKPSVQRMEECPRSDPEPLAIQPISSIPMDSTQGSGNISQICTTLVVYNPCVSMIPDSSLPKETPICMTEPTFSQPPLISLLSERQLFL